MMPGGAERIRVARDLELEIILEDRWLLAVNKPAGWLVAPVTWDRTRRNLMLALQTGIDQKSPWAVKRGLRYVKNIHRLDAETTGVLLLAKSRLALARCSRLFRERAVTKTYVEVVEGVPGETVFNISRTIASSLRRPATMIIDKQRGNPSRTRVELVRRDKGRSVLRVMPDTGRTHQIRVHLASVGLPVVGDPRYGRGRKGDRLQLHASALNFVHPFTKTEITITAPLPADFPPLEI
jgi:23S rRNA pseudouridine1911/1915/1917 synthase